MVYKDIGEEMLQHAFEGKNCDLYTDTLLDNFKITFY
jgi:hypothetical protein